MVGGKEKKEQEDALFRKLAEQTELSICSVYGLDYIRGRVGGCLWLGTGEDLEDSYNFAEPLNSEGALCSKFDPDGNYLGSMVYLNPKLREKLANSSFGSRLSENEDLGAYLVLIEEVSHFVYQEYYLERHGERPHGCIKELIAALDRYNIVQRDCNFVNGERVGSVTEDALLLSNEGYSLESYRGRVKGEYIIGHRLGIAFIFHLNCLHGQGQNVDDELLKFYLMTNKDQLIYLVNELNLDWQVFSDYEVDQLRNLFSDFRMELDSDGRIVESGEVGEGDEEEDDDVLGGYPKPVLRIR
ncbi:hypothetical protein KKE45_00260 [Patescibacteria group bacterium]|nr:hypothetical protein [Patescibacteria group bacterium]